jgi:hypothetical protein
MSVWAVFCRDSTNLLRLEKFLGSVLHGLVVTGQCVRRRGKRSLLLIGSGLQALQASRSNLLLPRSPFVDQDLLGLQA